MGNIQVTTAAQAIYPDGFQEPFIIKNLGPYTVYVGQDSSLDSTNLPLPPSGTLEWDSERPLWVIGHPFMPSNLGAYTTLSIQRNSNAPQFNNDFDTLLFKQTNPGLGLASNPLECTAFSSLVISMSNPNNVSGAIIPASRYDVAVNWYDMAGNYITTDSAQIPYANVLGDAGNNAALANMAAGNLIGPTLAYPSTATFKVKGSFCFVRILNTAAGLGNLTWTVTGSTRDLKPSMNFTSPAGLPIIGAGLTGNTFYATSDAFSIQNGTSGYNFADVVLPPIGRNWKVGIRNGAAITVAGGMFVRNAFDAAQGIDDFPIAVIAASDVQSFEFKVPIYEPFKCSFPRIPQSAGPVNLADMRVTFTCTDYDT